MKINQSNIKKAKKYLDKDYCIGIPTETVYGLAANAYSDSAVQDIYKIKKRPKSNPLIVHYSNINNLKKDCLINDNFLKLYKKFSPGPITYILKKRKNSLISTLATAKLKTVAIRFPSDIKIRKILKKIDFPLAMPSANISSKISPVDARDVFDEFGKKIKIIINGGRSKIGVESTVLDLTEGFKILRPGAISAKQINKIIKKKVYVIKNHQKIKSPGSLKGHYSPGIKTLLNQKKNFKKHAFITFGKSFKDSINTFNLSQNGNLIQAAKNLYKVFRKIKNLKYKKIYVSKIPHKGIGLAINDRLKKAAQ